MNKVIVNNQVVKMRKFVKQAKVQIINKLVKDIKLLKIKKGTEKQLEKNKRKCERLLSKIEIIKKISVDSVSKMALLKRKDWKAVLSNKTADLEERSFAMLADFESVQAEVENFHSNNSHLIKILPDLMQQWEQKQNLSSSSKKLTASEIRKKKREKRLKQKNKKTSKSFSNTENKTLKSEEKEDTCVETSNIGVEKNISSNKTESSFLFKDTEPSKSELLESSDNENTEAKQNETASVRTSVVSSLTQSSTDKTDTVQNLKGAVSQSPCLSMGNNVNKKQNKIETKVMLSLNLEELKDCDEIPINRSLSGEEIEENTSDTSQNSDSEGDSNLNDPFFTNGDSDDVNSDNNNESYHKSDEENSSKASGFTNLSKKLKSNLRNNPRTFGGTADRKNDFSNRKNSFKQKFKHRTNKQKDFKRQSTYGSRNMPNKKFSDKPEKFQKVKLFKNSKVAQNNFKSKTNDQYSRKKTKPLNEAGILHPSWEAKRKLGSKMPALVPFQGKKIKFDD